MSSSISGDMAGESRLLLESMGRAVEAALRPGQRIAARVLEMLETGDVLLDLGASRAVARANVPLRPGDRVVLDVVKGGAADAPPELRIVTIRTTVAVTPQAAAAQPPVTPQPPVAAQSPVPAPPLVTLQPAVTAQLPVALQPPVTAQPPVAAQPPVNAQPPVTAQAPVSVQSLVTAQQPVAVQPPVTVQPPVPAQPPVTAQLPAAAQLPAVVQPPHVAQALGAVQPPAAAQPPGAAGPSGPPVALTARDLPVILRALAELAPMTPTASAPTAPMTPLAPAGIPMAKAGQAFLQAAAAANLPPAVVEQIQRVLAPLHAALPAAELAPALRAFLAQSGLFTENHLGAALAAAPRGEHPGPLTAAADQRPVNADLRLLLGALTTPGTPPPEPVRVFGEAILQQQLVVAEQVAAMNDGQVIIPVMFGEEPVDIRFTWDREAHQDTHERLQPDDDRAISLGVFVNLNIFGGIEARIVWKPESFAVTFYVEREATRAIVEAGLTELSKELSASGFSAVAANVWLNPDRIAAGAAPVKRPIPAGTILDVVV